MLLTYAEFESWVAQEETREQSLEDISQKYMQENERKMQTAQGIFPLLILFRIIYIVAAFIVVVKLAIKLCTNEKGSPKHFSYIKNQTKPSHNEPKWYPTGWVFNEKTQKWDPPDYLSAEAEEKWAWDENKRIWVDKAKAARLERYYEFRKSQGKEPTYEEWKAAREKEKR